MIDDNKSWAVGLIAWDWFITSICDLDTLCCPQEFDVNNIFIKCCLTEPQAKGVSNAIKLVDPHFQPVVKEAHNQIRYPSLLKLWYSDRDNLDIKLKSVPGKLERELDESRLQELFEEQISRELSGFTPIMSIEDNKEQNTENQRLKEMFLDCRSKWKEALIKTFDNEMYKTRYSRGVRILTSIQFCFVRCSVIYNFLNLHPMWWTYSYKS